MANELWKQFDANPLTHSAAHYLMAIEHHIKEHGYARVTDIAKALNITRGSCSISLKALKKRGWVSVDGNRFLRLSDEGQRMALLVQRIDRVLVAFLHNVLGVSQAQAEIDACKMEHLLSLESSLRLAGFVQFVQNSDPVVSDFISKLRSEAPSCRGTVEKCALCENTCLAIRDPRQPAQPPRKVAVRRRARTR